MLDLTKEEAAAVLCDKCEGCYIEEDCNPEYYEDIKKHALAKLKAHIEGEPK